MTYEMYACYVYLKPKRCFFFVFCFYFKESVYALNMFILTFKNLFHQLGIGMGNIEKNQQFAT